ncbi:hypothetical protein BGZ94_001060 [Podila epigama]|nr:hypothetical protein BGZ94_001060 [Podila epigama]
MDSRPISTPKLPQTTTGQHQQNSSENSKDTGMPSPQETNSTSPTVAPSGGPPTSSGRSGGLTLCITPPRLVPLPTFDLPMIHTGSGGDPQQQATQQQQQQLEQPQNAYLSNSHSSDQSNSNGNLFPHQTHQQPQYTPLSFHNLSNGSLASPSSPSYSTLAVARVRAEAAAAAAAEAAAAAAAEATGETVATGASGASELTRSNGLNLHYLTSDPQATHTHLHHPEHHHQGMAIVGDKDTDERSLPGGGGGGLGGLGERGGAGAGAGGGGGKIGQYDGDTRGPSRFPTSAISPFSSSSSPSPTAATTMSPSLSLSSSSTIPSSHTTTTHNNTAQEAGTSPTTVHQIDSPHRSQFLPGSNASSSSSLLSSSNATPPNSSGSGSVSGSGSGPGLTHLQENAMAERQVSEILPNFLYLGGELVEESQLEELESLGIGRVLNMAENCDDALVLDRWGGQGYLKVGLRDHVDQDLRDGLDRAIQFISSSDIPIYVHCQAGKSRSVATVIGYLIQEHRWPLKKAYDHVVERRRCMSPNIGFVSQLIMLEERVLGRENAGGLVSVGTAEDADPSSRTTVVPWMVS